MNLQQATARRDALLRIVNNTSEKINPVGDSTYNHITAHLIGIMNVCVSRVGIGNRSWNELERDYDENRVALVRYLSLVRRNESFAKREADSCRETTGPTIEYVRKVVRKFGSR